MSFVLAVLLLIVTAVLQGTAQVGLVERFALLNAVVIAMFVARKRILAAGHNWAGQLGQRLATRHTGMGRRAAWMTTPAVAGATGFALGDAVGLDRGSRTSRLAGTIGRDRLADRRLARHSARARETIQAREHSEIRVGALGEPELRSSVSVDGPVARTRRARAARERVEQDVARHHRHRHDSNASWDTTAPRAVEDDADIVDAEEL